MNIPEKLKSRKFLLVLGYIIVKLVTEAVGWHLPEEILYAVLGWTGVEGAVDFAKWFNKK